MEKCKERTIGSLREANAAYMMSGSKRAKAKNFHNVVQEAIILCGEEDNIRVLEFCALPLLHILLGIVNRTYAEMIMKVPEVSQWPADLHLHIENYHGQAFEGNECKRLLENLPLLQDILTKEQLEEISPLVQILETFQQINHYVHQEEVDMHLLHESICGFRDAWHESGMSLTTKAHMIIDHLEDFVRSWGGRHISRFSEQAHESTHAEFLKIWSKYRVKNIQHPQFKDRLLRATLDYNGSHGF